MLLVPVLVLIVTASPRAQTVTESYEPQQGVLRIGDAANRAIALTDRGHTIIAPDGCDVPVGVVIFLDGFRVQATATIEPGSFEGAALAAGFSIVRVTTGNPLDFYFDDVTMNDVTTRLQDIIDAQGWRDVPVYLAGMSLGGTRALRLTIFLKQTATEYWLSPSAVAVVDAPLDMVRMWHGEKKSAADNVHPGAADEGRWVTYLLEKNLGGTPDTARDAYIAYSPYTHTAPHSGNARHLGDIKLRAYHEPDIDWWIANRGKSYYQMNSLDMAALITDLRIAGNTRAELVTTHNKRDGHADGTSPHTWSFVDNSDLLEWFRAN